MTRRTALLRGVLCALLWLAAPLLVHAADRMADNRLVIGLPLEPPHLDPTATSAEATLNVVQSNVFEGLTRITDQARVVPGLASRWEVSPDGLTWRFFLRPGVRFHDGAPLTADVVKASLDRARGADSTNPLQGLLKVVAAVYAEDALTVRIELAQPAAALPTWLGWGNLAIVAPATAGTNTTRPVGTGPFRFATWRKGEAIDLVRNDGYWGTPARLRAVTFRVIPDPAASVAALRAGDIDAFPNLPSPESLAALRGDPRFTVSVGSTEGETLIAINNARPPFNDVRVRRALAHAIDRRAIITGAMYGYGVPIGSHFSPTDPAALDLTGRYPHSPKLARALLREAGVDLRREYVLQLPPVYYARRSGEIIAAQLAAVGLRVRLQNIEWAQWLDQVHTRADFDLTIVSHTEPLDYDIYGRKGYYFGYDSAAYRDLLAQLDRTPEGPARTALLQQVQRKLADDAVNVWLFELPKLGVWRRELTGLWRNSPVQSMDVTAAGWGPVAGTGTSPVGAGLPATWPATGSTRSPATVMAAAWALGLAGLALFAWAARGVPARLWLSRLGGALLTLAGASVLIFLLVQVLPGDPAAFMLGLNASPEALAALRVQYGLDIPAWQQYLHWIGGLLQGDLGTSYTYRVPVASLVAERLAVSLPLAVLALLLAVLLAFPWGLAAAARRGQRADRLLMTLAQAGLALPNFWLGLLLVMALAAGLGWFPAGGFPGWSGGLAAGLHALWLPALALAFPQACILARVVRTALDEALAQDYVRTARAKGLTRRQALWRHALPNAWLPVLTLLGLQFSFLLAGAVVIETTFALPGVGRLVFQATEQRDLMVVRSLVLLLVAAVVLVNLWVDLACRRVDPRLRGAP